MKKLSFLVIVILGLSACADTQTIYVPTPVICNVPMVAQPAFPTEKLVATDNIQTMVWALVVENDLRKTYEMKLVAANKACN